MKGKGERVSQPGGGVGSTTTVTQTWLHKADPTYSRARPKNKTHGVKFEAAVFKNSKNPPFLPGTLTLVNIHSFCSGLSLPPEYRCTMIRRKERVQWEDGEAVGVLKKAVQQRGERGSLFYNDNTNMTSWHSSAFSRAASNASGRQPLAKGSRLSTSQWTGKNEVNKTVHLLISECTNAILWGY